MVAPEEDRLSMARATLGAHLRNLRERQQWPLGKVAAAAGLSASYLSELERGRKLPTLEALLAIANAYELLVVELLDGVYPFGSRQQPAQRPVIRDGRRSI